MDCPYAVMFSCVTDCPYDGPTPPQNVARVAKALMDIGCYEISLGDTIGAATPLTTSQMLEAVQQVVPVAKLAGHFHDTKGQALNNIEVCLGYGLRTFDAAVGGLGGCPYAPGAKGNVATEAVVDLLASKGYEAGIDVEELRKVSAFAKSLKGQP